MSNFKAVDPGRQFNATAVIHRDWSILYCSSYRQH